jgi:hypothetical protein
MWIEIDDPAPASVGESAIDARSIRALHGTFQDRIGQIRDSLGLNSRRALDRGVGALDL